MSRLAALLKVESFRKSVQELLVLDESALNVLRAQSIEDIASTPSLDVVDDLSRRAFGLMYEAAVRDGVADIRADLLDTFPESSADVERLAQTITPGDDDKERVEGVDERDGYLPILVDHRFALDMRILDSDKGRRVAIPFVSARVDFDATLVVGNNAAVFQINIAELDALIGDLTKVRDRARSLATSIDLPIPGWARAVSS